MPVVRNVRIGKYARLGLWRIDEAVDELPVPDGVDLGMVHSDVRRLEIQAVYALLAHLTGDKQLIIHHNEDGSPKISGSYISVSHTRGWVAILLSEQYPVGVDIEYISNRVERVVSRFVRHDEVARSVESQLLHWSVKEAVFKLWHTDKLQYFDIRLHPFEVLPQGSIRVDNLKTSRTIDVSYETNPHFVLTYAVDIP